jgi:hypothetical protein
MRCHRMTTSCDIKTGSKRNHSGVCALSWMVGHGPKDVSGHTARRVRLARISFSYPAAAPGRGQDLRSSPAPAKGGYYDTPQFGPVITI